MIAYFISYAVVNGNGLGFGNCQIDLQYPIRSHKDVDVVTDLVREQVVGTPVVLSFTRFDTAGGQTR